MELDDEEAHEKLLRSVSALRRGKKVVGGGEGAEEGGRETGGSKLGVEDLVGELGTEKKLGELKNQLRISDDRTKLLSAPVHRLEREKILRTIAYGETKQTLNQWSGIVHQNRVADQLVFPLDQKPVRLQTVAEAAAERFQLRTPLEIESARILGKSKNNLRNSEELTEAEKELMKAMSLRETKQRTAELQKLRHLMSYQEAKFKRQKKIKSKRYHRLMKKQKRKEILKEFEDLKTKDPDAANERLEVLEKDRIMERAVLKHRGTGKWAKQLRLHARHDEKTKESLQQQLRFGRDLTRKHGVESSDSETEPTPAPETKKLTLEELLERVQDEEDTETPSKANPWLRSGLSKIRKDKAKETASTAVTVTPHTHSPQESDAEPPMQKPRKRKKQRSSEDAKETSTPDIYATVLTEEPPKEETKRKKKRKMSSSKLKKSCTTEDDVVMLDEPTQSDGKAGLEEESIDAMFDGLSEKIVHTARGDGESDGGEGTSTWTLKSKKRKTRDKEKKKASETPPSQSDSKNSNKSDGDASKTADRKTLDMLDPNKLLHIEKKLKVNVASKVMENVAEDDEIDGEEEKFLAEAFADDDVIESFEKEKAALEESEKPKDIDLTLPGWGEWAGPDIQPSRSKRKRFLIKAPPGPPRKDRDLPGVIISEKEDNTIRKYQVNSLPFPFTCVEDFEASVAHPLGKEWNTPLSHTSLVQPSLVSKQGALIAPLDKEVALKNPNAEADWGDSD